MHARMQLAVTDMTAMPVTGSVFIGSLASYAPAINTALAGKRCAIGNASVCAYNVVDDSQVSCITATRVSVRMLTHTRAAF